MGEDREQRRRRETRDPLRLGEVGGARLLKAFAHFVTEPADAPVVQIGGKSDVLFRAELRDLTRLPVQIPVISRFGTEMPDCPSVERREPRHGVGQLLVGALGCEFREDGSSDAASERLVAGANQGRVDLALAPII